MSDMSQLPERRFEDTLAVEDTLFVDRSLILLTVTWAYQVTLRMLRALDELFGLSLEGSTSQPEILEIFDPFWMDFSIRTPWHRHHKIHKTNGKLWKCYSYSYFDTCIFSTHQSHIPQVRHFGMSSKFIPAFGLWVGVFEKL